MWNARILNVYDNVHTPVMLFANSFQYLIYPTRMYLCMYMPLVYTKNYFTVTFEFSRHSISFTTS